MIEDKKKVILKGAELLFATKGFMETTVSDIARESGINDASIYSYFNNKKNILFEIYAGYLKEAVETLKNHFQGMKEAGPKLRKSIWHYLADMKFNPNYARILMMAQRENPDYYSSENVRYVKEYSGLILKVIQDGQEEGFFRKDISPRLIRNMAMGASVFAAFDSLVQNRGYEPNEESDLIYQLVFNAAHETATKAIHGKKLKEARAEFRKSQILDTASQLFSTKGFSNATISEIAKQADLGDATLYEYFNSKEAILLTIPESYFQELISDKNLMFGGFPDSERSLREIIWRWMWLVWVNPEFSRILFLDLFRNISFYSSPAYGHFDAFLSKIETVIRQGQAEGLFRENISLPTYLHMLVGTVDQYMLSQFLLNRTPPGVAELNDIVNSLVRAIKV